MLSFSLATLPSWNAHAGSTSVPASHESATTIRRSFRANGVLDLRRSGANHESDIICVLATSFVFGHKVFSSNGGSEKEDWVGQFEARTTTPTLGKD